MREYCRIYYAWGEKVLKSPRVTYHLIESNLKRQMTPEEGLLFIRLMKRTYSIKKRKNHVRRMG